MKTRQRALRALRTAAAMLGAATVATTALAQLGGPGYTAFPDADPLSGRFLVIEHGWASLTETVHVEVTVAAPSAKPTFRLGIYDGDGSSAMDIAEPGAGAWDLNAGPVECTYTLYADKDRLGAATATVVGTWSSQNLADRAWTWLSTPLAGTGGAITNSSAALGSDGKCHYVLEATWTNRASLPSDAQNCFKVQADGQVYIRGGQSAGLFGYSQNQFGPPDPGWPMLPFETTFDGGYDFVVDVSDKGAGPRVPWAASALSMLTFGDGDFDYGDGDPVDNTVSYSITAPGAAWTVRNGHPSGNQVWELFTLAVGFSDGYGGVVTSLPLGDYRWKITDPATVAALPDGSPNGITNAIYLGSQYDMYAVPPPPVGNGATRTIGYWATHLTALSWATASGHDTFQLESLRNQCAPLLSQVLAILWGDIAKNGTKKRSALGQARMQMGQQLMAAYANVACLGTSPRGALLADALAAWQGTTIPEILRCAGELDAFNNGGDAVQFSVDQATVVGRADPKKAKDAAWKSSGFVGFIYPGDGFI